MRRHILGILALLLLAAGVSLWIWPPSPGAMEFVHGSCDAETMAAMRATLEQGHGPYPFGKSRGRAGRRGR